MTCSSDGKLQGYAKRDWTHGLWRELLGEIIEVVLAGGFDSGLFVDDFGLGFMVFADGFSFVLFTSGFDLFGVLFWGRCLIDIPVSHVIRDIRGNSRRSSFQRP